MSQTAQMTNCTEDVLQAFGAQFNSKISLSAPFSSKYCGVTQYSLSHWAQK